MNKENGPTTIGDILTELGQLKDQTKPLNKQLKEIKERKAELDTQLLQYLHDQGITQSQNEKRTATINEQTFFTIENYTLFINFALDHKMEHLIPRTLSTPACQELVNAGMEIPGITTFTKETISLRKR